MALRTIPRDTDEQNALIARFQTAAKGEPPTQEQLDLQEDIRARILHTATHIDASVEPSRAQALALTHLEEALMWAGRAILQ